MNCALNILTNLSQPKFSHMRKIRSTVLINDIESKAPRTVVLTVC